MAFLDSDVGGVCPNPRAAAALDGGAVPACDTDDLGERPLLIDLDGCLIKTDLLYETALAYVTGNPLRILKVAVWLLRGRAYLKRRLAEVATLDMSLIPVNEEVATLALEAKRAGRMVYLVTACDDLLATGIAARFAFLDGVVASDGCANLAGARKAQRVLQMFPGGFDYAGDSAADLHVWKYAAKAIVVGAPARVVRSVRALGRPTQVLPRPNAVSALVRAMRPHQWSKNALIFIPALLGGTIGDPDVFVRCLLAFIATGLVASGVYLLNDLADLAHDRCHWSKRKRPIASGDLSIRSAAVAAFGATAAGLALAAWIGTAVLLGLAAYVAVTLAYSLWLKRVPVLDSFILAGLFTLRLAIGIAAAEVVASPWLLVFSMFLFASLSFAKRHTEILRLIGRGATAAAGRGYVAADAPLVLGLGLATGTGSILIMVLYLIFDAFGQSFYGNPNWLWVLPAVLFLWFGRIWLVGQRGQLHDDPVAFALKDRVSLGLGGALGAGFAFAWSGVPL